jgi:hypothetical protein
MNKSSPGSYAANPRHNVLVRMLLRNYAKNKRRLWRNSSHDAFFDATMQIEGPLTLAVTVPFALLNLLLGRTVMPMLAKIAYGTYSNGLIIVCAVSIVTILMIDRKLKTYESVPGIEAAYDTVRDRRLVYVYYACTLVIFAAMFLAAYVINGWFPAAA